MNERIKELAEKVGFDLYSEDKENMFQEFAELIVRECADICANGTIENPMGLMYSKEIKRHFGVK